MSATPLNKRPILGTFAQPDNADADKVNAEIKDGVLKVHIAKSERSRPKMIEAS